MPAVEQNGFPEYKRLIMHEFDHLNSRCDKLEEKIDGARTDIAMLKVRASTWGALSGLIVAAILSALIKFLT